MFNFILYGNERNERNSFRFVRVTRESEKKKKHSLRYNKHYCGAAHAPERTSRNKNDVVLLNVTVNISPAKRKIYKKKKKTPACGKAVSENKFFQSRVRTENSAGTAVTTYES